MSVCHQLTCTLPLASGFRFEVRWLFGSLLFINASGRVLKKKKTGCLRAREEEEKFTHDSLPSRFFNFKKALRSKDSIQKWFRARSPFSLLRGEEHSLHRKTQATDWRLCDWGVYRIPLECGCWYIGQTGRCITQGMTEHRRYLRIHAFQSQLARHIAECNLCHLIWDECTVLVRNYNALAADNAASHPSPLWLILS